MLDELARQLERRTEAPLEEIAPGLGLSRRTSPGHIEALVYDPFVCLIVQGEKHITLGRERLVLSEGRFAVVSQAMPVVARVARARPDSPFLSLVSRLDVAELRRLVAEMSLPRETPQRSFAVAEATPELLDVFRRYAALADSPGDVSVLAPLIRREVHYRLLRSTTGQVLRGLFHRESYGSNMARAIARLREDYRERLEMSDLAQSVGMSPSSFYRHFKALTSTTPLQYQKDLRLTEARRLLLGGEHSVSTAASAVGYQSASQFSREYSRKFGTTPRSDLPAVGIPEGAAGQRPPA
jgi:AraC-like DNA-binding protein